MDTLCSTTYASLPLIGLCGSASFSIILSHAPSPPGPPFPRLLTPHAQLLEQPLACTDMIDILKTRMTASQTLLKHRLTKSSNPPKPQLRVDQQSVGPATYDQAAFSQVVRISPAGANSPVLIQMVITIANINFELFLFLLICLFIIDLWKDVSKLIRHPFKWVDKNRNFAPAYVSLHLNHLYNFLYDT